MSRRVLPYLFRFYCTSSTSRVEPSAWDIFVSVALIRPPIIAPPLNAIEKRYQNVMIQKEFENSLRSDFELRQLRDERLLKEREKLKMSGEGANLKEEIGILASVDEENWRKEANRIRKQLAIGDLSRFSKADSKSVQRKIDEPLVLIVRQRFGQKDGYQSKWQLPQLQNQPGESLKQTSERCCTELFSDEIHVTGISNAPFSVYTYRYPAQLRQRLKTSSRGAVVFFFKALYTERNMLTTNKNEITDYKWVNREEFATNVQHAKPYFLALSTLFPSFSYSSVKDGLEIDKSPEFLRKKRPQLKA